MTPCPILRRALALLDDPSPAARLRRADGLRTAYRWAALGMLFGGRAPTA